MAGVHFVFNDFIKLLDLNIGLSKRLDENRAESFTLLYCDFSGLSAEVVATSLQNILRDSDSIANYGSDYFFTLPYTDKYGASIVSNMFSEFFAKDLNSSMVSYPKDGETSRALLEELRDAAIVAYKNELLCLDSFLVYKQDDLAHFIK